MARDTADRILERIDTLSLAELKEIDAVIHELIERIAGWQRPAEDTVEQHQAAGGCYRLEYTKCNKPTCKRCAEGQGHGPYWYRYTYKPGGGQRKEYIGKTRPDR